MEFDEKLHESNMDVFRKYLEKTKGAPVIWAAWGTIINKREYLKLCLKDMIEIAEIYGSSWKKAGKVSKHGHPHHPLYLRKDTQLEKFDIENYANMCLQIKTDVL